MTAWASRNGTVAAADEVMVPITDRGFLLGDAVFETLRTYGGRLFAAEAHLDRLAASLAGIGMDEAPPREVIADWMRAVVQRARRSADGEWVVRIMVTRGSGGHGTSPRGAGPPEVFVLARPLPAPARETYERGVRVVSASTRRVPMDVQDPRIKAASALGLVLARREADAAGADEALLCNSDGDYLEATAANLLVLHEGRFHTPLGSDGVLEGVTLRLMVPILEREGWTAAYGPIDPDLLFGADEVLLTQTTREVLPVVEVDGRTIGAGRPGPVATLLRERFLGQVDAWLDP